MAEAQEAYRKVTYKYPMLVSRPAKQTNQEVRAMFNSLEKATWVRICCTIFMSDTNAN